MSENRINKYIIMTIKDLQPKNVWTNFYSLTRCPRPSKHEEVVRKFLLDWAAKRGIEAFADETGNVIMRAPATPGFENRRGVILQAHMDMVPQKVADKVHDFKKDPIETQIIGDWVGAVGTTLGADDGIGVALAMSVLEDKSLQHGPVEVLITYDEETGMTGAEHLRPGLFKGDILLNLDSEDEGELCIGCAGGLDGTGDFSFRKYRTPKGQVGFKYEVKGLQGGHSGMDISLYRANANRVMARTLLPLVEKYGVRVASMNGGTLRNAIPFEAAVEIIVPKENEEAVKKVVEAVNAEIRDEFLDTDPGMQFLFERLPRVPGYCIPRGVTLRALKAIFACPTGVIRMSSAFEGLTETSTNLAMVRTNGGHILVHSLMRSSRNSAKEALAERMRCVFELAGAKFTTYGGYSGWTPKPDTPVYKLITDIWKEISGEEMKVNATHGGLECALLGAKYPNWEMASIGPTIVHPHSPDERVKISTVANSWAFLVKILERIPVK